MARYIDAEVLERRIKKNIKPEIPEEKAFLEWCKDECIRQAYAMPTADVVPKSEVYNDDHRKQVTCYTMGCQEGDKIRREVAREIFEKIYEDCFDQFGYINYDALDELKKKYTEGSENG